MSALLKVTAQDVLSWEPCWVYGDTDEKKSGRRKVLRVLRPLGKHFDALGILGLSKVAAEDRLWVVLRPAMLPESILRLFAARCARRALAEAAGTKYPPPALLYEVVDVVERFARHQADELALWAAYDAASTTGASYTIPLLRAEGRGDNYLKALTACKVTRAAADSITRYAAEDAVFNSRVDSPDQAGVCEALLNLLRDLILEECGESSSVPGAEVRSGG